MRCMFHDRLQALAVAVLAKVLPPGEEEVRTDGLIAVETKSEGGSCPSSFHVSLISSNVLTSCNSICLSLLYSKNSSATSHVLSIDSDR